MLKIHHNRLTSKRGKIFTEDEKLRLYHCMVPDLKIIDSKSMDSITVVRKAEAWKRVTFKFNSSPSVFRRTTEQLKKCFENAKCRKQWVKPGSGEAAERLHSEQQILGVTSTGTGPGATVLDAVQATTLGEILQGNVEASVHHASSNNYQLYNELQPEIEEHLDNIKCELIDMTDGSSQDGNHSPVEVLEAAAEFSDEPAEQETNGVFEGVVRSMKSANRRAPSIRASPTWVDVVGDTDATLFPEDMDDVAETTYLDAPTYRQRVPRLYVAPSRKKQPRGASSTRDDVADLTDLTDLADDAHNQSKENAQSPHDTGQPQRIKDLQEQLLRTQVREAEAAASAAEVQLRLNQLALQHAQAEEVRRQQLHDLRMRRLAQLTSPTDTTTLADRR